MVVEAYNALRKPFTSSLNCIIIFFLALFTEINSATLLLYLLLCLSKSSLLYLVNYS